MKTYLVYWKAVSGSVLKEFGTDEEARKWAKGLAEDILSVYRTYPSASSRGRLVWGVRLN